MSVADTSPSNTSKFKPSKSSSKKSNDSSVPKIPTIGFNDYLKTVRNGIIFGTAITIVNVFVSIFVYYFYSFNWYLIIDYLLLFQSAMFFLISGIVGAFGPSVSLRLAMNSIFKTSLDKTQSIEYMMSMIRYFATASWLIIMAFFLGWIVRTFFV